MDEWKIEWMAGWMDQFMGRCTVTRSMRGLLDVWIDGKIDEKLEGWIA